VGGVCCTCAWILEGICLSDVAACDVGDMYQQPAALFRVLLSDLSRARYSVITLLRTHRNIRNGFVCISPAPCVRVYTNRSNPALTLPPKHTLTYACLSTGRPITGKGRRDPQGEGAPRKRSEDRRDPGGAAAPAAQARQREAQEGEGGALSGVLILFVGFGCVMWEYEVWLQRCWVHVMCWGGRHRYSVCLYCALIYHVAISGAQIRALQRDG
jgi:hypothetical protein